ncbi:MAG TPA: hypothetical protein DCM86_16045 [Verrucomicrobiales bacterium]|nr:hypothetical protein [Verrucomicrobiales bacterium]
MAGVISARLWRVEWILLRGGIKPCLISALDLTGYETVNSGVRAAFKEWAVVVDALGRGDQIVVLRKGGISEGKGGFKMEHDAFWLFPTMYHAQADSVIPSAVTRWGEIQPLYSDASSLRIEFGARVEQWLRVEDLGVAERLKGQHIWKDQVIADRYDWGREQNIFAIALRVYRLASPVHLPMVPAYGGCKSWIDLESDLSLEGATPVLADGAFTSRLESFRKALSPVPAS